MKILFAFSCETWFTREFCEMLKEYCQVLCINVQLESAERKTFLEKIKNFCPDIVHCNDAKAFEFFKNCKKILYSCHAQTFTIKSDIQTEHKAIKESAICVFYSRKVLEICTKLIQECNCVYISLQKTDVHTDEEQSARAKLEMRKCVKAHLFYYFLIKIHDSAKLHLGYNRKSFLFARRPLTTPTSTRLKPTALQICDSAPNVPAKTPQVATPAPYTSKPAANQPYTTTPTDEIAFYEMRNLINILESVNHQLINSRNLIITEKAVSEKIRNQFKNSQFIDYAQFKENGIELKYECLPFYAKSFENSIFPLIYGKKVNRKNLVLELIRITKKNIFFADMDGKIFTNSISLKTQLPLISENTNP